MRSTYSHLQRDALQSYEVGFDISHSIRQLQLCSRELPVATDRWCLVAVRKADATFSTDASIVISDGTYMLRKCYSNMLM